MSASLEQFDLFDPGTQQCPFPGYAEMRANSPVFRSPKNGLVLVTTHDLCVEVLRDWQTYSSAFMSPGGSVSSEIGRELKALRDELGGYPSVPTMLTADPPAHSRYRRLVSKAFTPKAVAAYEPAIRAIAERLASTLEPGQPVEFVEQFGVPLPVEAIAAVLNVPDDRIADFKRWSDCTVAGFGSVISRDERLANERGIIEFQHYFADQLQQRQAKPQPDFLTNLVNARIEPGEQDESGQEIDPRPLDMAELLSILIQLLVAGNETTTKLLTESVRLLGEHPETWTRIGKDHSVISSVTEEALRLSAPTQGMFRVVTRDTVLGDVALVKGDRVIVMFASASRDETLFADPDRFDVDRPHSGEHLAFGKGTHFCLGANLSRLEMKIALETLTHRFSSVSLDDGNTFAYYPSFMLRGLTALQVTFR